MKFETIRRLIFLKIVLYCERKNLVYISRVAVDFCSFLGGFIVQHSNVLDVNYSQFHPKLSTDLFSIYKCNNTENAIHYLEKFI